MGCGAVPGRILYHSSNTAPGATGFCGAVGPACSAIVRNVSDSILTVSPARRVAGRLAVPGDKSVSHRALLLAAVAHGVSHLDNLGPGEDCRSTIRCLRQLGVAVEPVPDRATAVTVTGRGLAAFVAPGTALDAGNSGTTTRLLLGLLAACPWATHLDGDASLRRRPMRRVFDPLTQMGAVITSTGGCLPAVVTGGRLRGIDYRLPVASAQVKSGILLAGLHAEGVTVVREPVPTRDHTERAVVQFGGRVDRLGDGGLQVLGGQRLTGTSLRVPGDPSSAAFWAVAAAALPGSDVTIDGVGLNPTRLAYLDVLRRAGACIDVRPSATVSAEPAGSIRVRHGGVAPVDIGPDEVPSLIDELPVLAALATYGGRLSVSGAAELRVKESDRIADLAAGLRALGGHVDERPDGFTVDGTRPLAGGDANAVGDHRLAMAFAIAALGGRGASRIHGADAVSVSYPGFFEALEALTA